jgi:hypothetical protein
LSKEILSDIDWFVGKIVLGKCPTDIEGDLVQRLGDFAGVCELFRHWPVKLGGAQRTTEGFSKSVPNPRARCMQPHVFATVRQGSIPRPPKVTPRERVKVTENPLKYLLALVTFFQTKDGFQLGPANVHEGDYLKTPED